MQVKTTTNETIDLRTLKLEEAVPEQQIEIYRHVHTQQFYIRHLDGRFEPVPLGAGNNLSVAMRQSLPLPGRKDHAL